eukprot:CAMPEP_0169171474 /NCGR_PEP_ID=MMETSP1015-20121227/62751_1 /TAXON_ID=342587 /ORGANISM="Karlodinium micrum, Strain CCMP2283" /LENGTH=35 /DNA_ID= /DNA_START= /DNA_END= /DNA_ORIENTATION=
MVHVHFVVRIESHNDAFDFGTEFLDQFSDLAGVLI